ncbi:MAG: hypothetical protein ACJ8AK_12310 [Gemmatimonadaceae bacterium]
MTAERLILLIAVVACSSGNSGRNKTAQSSDSSFAKLQQRGATVMGVDQYTSQHVFEPLPTGGRIVLQRKEADSAGEAVIREHMRTIAKAFAAGDFTLPGVVHAMEDVPGTQQMRALHDDITYTPKDLPRGGEVIIATSNPTAIEAVHEFLAFQRTDHRAGMHME